ncbi:MAG TPA: nucleotidyl transferase AbiEii/AbiGii toxin family protein [Steroidobacteraceae bacterium]
MRFAGTAIHKLLFEQPPRYSEDIDLVQTRAEPIGATVDAIRDALSWLGKCNCGLEQLAIDDDKLVACFHHYLKLEGQHITRAMAEQRMLQKLTGSLIEDIAPLLLTGVRYGESDAVQAFNGIWRRLINKVQR